MGRRQAHPDQSLYALLSRWSRRLSWKQTAEAFRTSWDKVFDAVEHVVTWGLEHRTLGQIDAIGVDEIQYSKGHKYLTLVYQIDLGATRLLWVGKERTIESFQGFFTTIGEEITSKIVFICSDMWEPYLKVNGEEPIMRRNVLRASKAGVSNTICSSLFGAVQLWAVTWRCTCQIGCSATKCGFQNCGSI